MGVVALLRFGRLRSSPDTPFSRDSTGRTLEEGVWQMLVEMYGWFTEGFDTADLQVARAWLAQLKAISSRASEAVEIAVMIPITHRRT